MTAIRLVDVSGKQLSVQVFHRASSEWVAVGEYAGKWVEVADATKEAAITRWQATASLRSAIRTS